MSPTSDERPSINPPFPVVAIGASAGGLDPLRTFLDNLPASPGMAFVIITHHPAGETSLLPQILADHTRLPVRSAEAGAALEVDCIYVALPDYGWVLQAGTLVRREPSGGATAPGGSRSGPPHPIDTFFRSLAGELASQAIGIVLSGTGSDGTLGVKAIKSQSGMIMAQDPDTAEFGSMPDSAIATGLVDYVLPPADMPATLVGYVTAHTRSVSPSGDHLSAIPEGILGEILSRLKSRTGNDFSGYKRSTLLRRIERRMAVHQLEDPDTYLRQIRANPAEADLLFREIIISVTNFFRDPEAWQALADGLLPDLLRSARDQKMTFRAWVAGCATGEEAYTLAILVREALDTLESGPAVQIFATDVDQEAIETARIGRYPTGIADDLTQDRLERFFAAEKRTYRVSREIRDMVVFAEHNILQDPPFTRMDLISCRNLLIYLERDLQKRLLPVLGYALRGPGILVLGTSESPQELTDAFSTIDKKRRIYRIADPEAALRLPDMPSRRRPNTMTASPAAWPEKGRREPGVESLSVSIERLLAHQFAPPAVVVNDRGEVVFIHGRTGRYLEPASGPTSNRLVEMARSGLRAPLAKALREVASGGSDQMEIPARVQTDGGTATLQLMVQRIRSPQSLGGLRLVAFRTPDAATGAKEVAVSTPPAEEKDAASPQAQGDDVEQLEQELRSVRQDKQMAVDELQSSNEELQSMNEELQSMNEELQSSNEELEVAKEESESLNEELRSVNAELEARVGELSEANDDLKNLLDSTQIATLFLDEDLRIKRFTESARDLVALRDADVGRPIDDLRIKLQYQNLSDDGEQVLRSLIPKEVKVQTTAGHWYLLRIQPYRTTQNVIQGLVCTFQDIQAASPNASNNTFFVGLVNTVREPLLVLDDQLRVTAANDGFYRHFALAPEAVEGASLFELAGGQWDHPELRARLAEVLPASQSFRDFELHVDGVVTGPHRLLLNGRQLEAEGETMILLAMEVAGPAPKSPAERDKEPSHGE